MNEQKLRRDNRSGFQGISWDVTRAKWIATWKPPGQPKINIGRFDSIWDAAAAYKEHRENYLNELSLTQERENE
jgi:hypothetical protein